MRLGDGDRGEDEDGEQREGRKIAAREGTAHGTLLRCGYARPAVMAAGEPPRSRVCRKQRHLVLSLQKVGDLPRELHSQPFLLASSLEHEERGQGLPVDLARLEGRQDLGGELFQIRGAVLGRIEKGQVERDERRIVAHAAIEEDLLHLPEGRLGRRKPAEAEVDLPFHPAQTHEVEIAADLLAERPHLGHEGVPLGEASHLRQTVEQIVPQAEQEPRVACTLQKRLRLPEEGDGPFGNALLDLRKGLLDQSSACQMEVPILRIAVLIDSDHLVEKLQSLAELPLIPPERGLEAQNLRFRLLVARKALAEEALRLEKRLLRAPQIAEHPVGRSRTHSGSYASLR